MGRHSKTVESISTLQCVITMMIFSIIASTLWLAPVNAAANDPTVKLTVYYEDMCPDSIRFITTQLYPAWQHFGADLNISFKPFGKANFTETIDGWVFTCQHGPRECVGNKVQACLLNMVQEQEIQVPLINCMMSSAHPPPPTSSCLDSLGISFPEVDWVEACAAGDEGTDLLHDIGVETHGLVPPLYSVPWVLFNDEYNKEDWEQGLENLSKVLCDKYLAGSSKCEVQEVEQIDKHQRTKDVKLVQKW